MCGPVHGAPITQLHKRFADPYLSLIRRLDLVVTDRLHGLAPALRASVPALAVDPVLGGAKVTAQSGILRWPVVVSGENLSTVVLDHWWNWCLSPAGSATAVDGVHACPRCSADRWGSGDPHVCLQATVVPAPRPERAPALPRHRPMEETT
ncbi:hypothetical protein [Streptomyces globisporus]|uniref:hypothetical protein n=1 Tax=Streptomyces globisporus TaxID=1908 RepID=UPI003798C580